MKNRTLVSVIIPAYNRPEFLKPTINSIIRQSISEIQVIVVSNGLNKENKEVSNSFNDNRIEFYEQENKGSPSAPRNYGIKKAKGKYIAFCDDDDIWIADKLEKQIAALENNPDCGICYTKMLRFDGKINGQCHMAGPADFKSLLFTNTVPISSVLVKRSLLNTHKLFCETKEVGNSEDYEFLLRLSLYTNLYFVDDYLIEYWTGDNRITKLDSRSDINNIFKYLTTKFRIYLKIYLENKAFLFSFF